MKKNKTIAYALAATLLVGGTFAGTKALFSDEAKVTGELSISTGDVDITTTGVENDWKIVRNGDENNGPSKEVTFDNLKVGDEITKQITVKNSGTLKAIVDLEANSQAFKKLNLPKGIEYSATFAGEKITDEGYSKKIMQPGETQTIELKLNVNGVDNDKHNAKGALNSDKNETRVFDLKDTYSLKAIQTQQVDENTQGNNVKKIVAPTK